MRGILEVVSDGLLGLECQHRMSIANPGWYQMLGYEPHSLDNNVFTWENVIRGRSGAGDGALRRLPERGARLPGRVPLPLP